MSVFVVLATAINTRSHPKHKKNQPDGCGVGVSPTSRCAYCGGLNRYQHHGLKLQPSIGYLKYMPK